MGITRRDFLKITGIGAALTGIGNTKPASAEEIQTTQTPTERQYKTFKDFAVDNYASNKAVEVTGTGSAGAFFYEREEDDGISRKEDFSFSGLKRDITIDNVINDASSFFSEQGFKTVGRNPERGTLTMIRESGKIRERYEATIGIYEVKTRENRRLNFTLTSLTTVYS